MTQLAMSVAALNSTSEFAKAYEQGVKKTEFWKPALEDAITLIARLPVIASRIYRNAYNPGKPIAPIDKNLDLTGESDLELRANSALEGRNRCAHVMVFRELHEYAGLRGQ